MPEDKDSGGEDRGGTAMKSSLSEEHHPELSPQTPGGAARKLTEEASEGDGVLDKAKRAVQEVDRQVSGEYERREDTSGG